MGSLYGKNDYESLLILPNAHMVSRFRKFASGIVTTLLCYLFTLCEYNTFVAFRILLMNMVDR